MSECAVVPPVVGLPTVIKWWVDRASIKGSSIDADMVSLALIWAWGHWANVCNIEPVFVEDAKDACVLTSFGVIDGPGKLLAYSQVGDDAWRRGMLKIQQKFDYAERWAFLISPPRGYVDFGRVALHEIGHLLGIPHLPPGNIMQPMYDVKICSLQSGDIQAAVSLYGVSAKSSERCLTR